MVSSRTSTWGASRLTCTEVLSDWLTCQQNPRTHRAWLRPPLLSGALQTCLHLSPSVISAASPSSFRNADTQHWHLLPATPSPQEPHTTLQLSLLSSLTSAAALTLPPTPEVGIHCSRAQDSTCACTNTALVARHQNLRFTLTFPSPHLAAAAPGAWLAMFSPVCHQKM